MKGGAVGAPDSWPLVLPPGTLAQKAELVTLTQALKLAKGKIASICMDSQYAFTMTHVHGHMNKAYIKIGVTSFDRV